jgi:hypothetical protein
MAERKKNCNCFTRLVFGRKPLPTFPRENMLEHGRAELKAAVFTPSPPSFATDKKVVFDKVRLARCLGLRF